MFGFGMLRFALVGKSLKHSVSAYVHKQLFSLRKIKAQYDLLETNKISSLMSKLSRYNGYNITFPFKEDMIHLLDGVDEKAFLLGAINTVIKGVGYNTDYFGFEQALNGLCGKEKINNAIVLGCGGFGKVCCHHLLRNGVETIIAVRNVEKVGEFVKKLTYTYSTQVKVADIKEIDKSRDLIINATPVGTYPDISKSPIDKAVQARFVFDAVYNPLESKFLQLYSKSGSVVTNGLPMLVWQAAEAQRLWLGVKFSHEEINQVIGQTKLYLQGQS